MAFEGLECQSVANSGTARRDFVKLQAASRPVAAAAANATCAVGAVPDAKCWLVAYWRVILEHWYDFQTMSTSQPSIQTATSRREAEAQVCTIITTHASEHLRLIGATRRRLRRCLPTAHEVVYEYRSWLVISYSPSERGYEGVLAIRADANGVRLYFNSGKGLPDPEKLLKGSGGKARYIDLEGSSTLARPAVASLIDETIARNPLPFEETGRGSVVIRSASTKKSPRRSARSAATASRRAR